MATGWQTLGAAAYLGAPKKPSTSTTAKQNRQSGNVPSYGTGNWTGESGSWLEPGTYSASVAKANPALISDAKNAGEVNQNIYAYMTAQGNGGGGSTTGTISRPATSGGSGSRGGGGGGGGGAAAPTLTQDQLAKMWDMLGQGRPQAEQAGAAFDAPDYAGPQISPFDSSMYDNLSKQLGQAVGNDRAQSDQAYGALGDYLTRNYANNPYETTPYATFGQAPGQSQDAMARMLASQGQNPNALTGAAYGAANAGDSAYSNLLGILGTNQRQDLVNRRYANQQDQANTGRMYDMAQLQGDTGIGLQKGQAQQAWQQRYDDRAADIYNQNYQGQLAEQQANWQRANTLADQNYATQNSYTNSAMSSVLSSLLPLIIQGKLTIPDVSSLFAQQSTNV